MANQLRISNGYDEVSLLSKISFSWLWKPVWNCFKGVDSQIKPFETPPKHLLAKSLGKQLKKNWQQVENEGKKSLLNALWKTFRNEICLASAILSTKNLIINVTFITIIKILLTSFGTQDERIWLHQYVTAAIFIFMALASTFVMVHSTTMAELIGGKFRISTSALVYEKLLKISIVEIKRINIGQLLNIFASDVGKFEENGKHVCSRFFDPLYYIVYLLLNYFFGGLPAVIGFLVILAIGIASITFSRMFKIIGKERAYLIDKRLKIIKEMITEARTMKLFCWENIYCRTIDKIRNKELTLCFKGNCFKIVNGTMCIISSQIGMFVTLILMNFMNIPITPPSVYSVFTVLIISQLVIVSLLSKIMENGVYALVSIKRIENILRINEIGKNKIYDNKIIQITNMSCSWNTTNGMWNIEDLVFKNVNLTIPKSALVIVTGPVATGKSTLLLAMANEMYVHSGEVRIGGSFTYLPQEPWLFPATIRENILFGLPYDESRYKNILNSCALLQDLTQLPNGDFCNVDDKGLTLSGGQKARIALARALYRQSDIYLLDDPLSAVDVKVGRHIWQNCFENSSKTMVIVSHNLQFLKEDNYIIYTDKEEICLNQCCKLKKTLKDNVAVDLVDELQNYNIVTDNNLDTSSTLELDNFTNAKGKTPNSLLFYCKMTNPWCGGWMVIVLNIFLAAIVQVVNTFYNFYFIKYVSQQDSDSEQDISLAYLGYFIIGEAFLRIVQYLVVFKLCLLASKQLHEKVLRSVIHAEMTFFHNHHTGHIINRFTNDIEMVDDGIPNTIFESVKTGMLILNLIIIGCYNNVICIVPLTLCLIFAFSVQYVYKIATIPIKEEEANRRGPIYTFMNCSLNGMAIIRSHQNQKKMVEEFNSKQNRHSGPWFLLKGIGQWMTFLCNVAGQISLCAMILLNILLPQYTDSSRFGMGIASTIVYGAYLEYMSCHLTHIDYLLFSVSRLRDYLKIPPEKGYVQQTTSVPPDWPKHGHISFNNVTLKYQTASRNALKHITFDIKKMEKIGIVGRTGAGKTSLLTVLFRLSNFQGTVTIDGIDIQTIDLFSYRKKLSVIPQNPVILNGSVRHNLDPEGEFADGNLWNVLESAELKEEVSKMELGLDGGMDQLSVGQKQLFCLARNLLHQNKIIVLDEATSNVDNKTDQIIQQLIRTKFSTSTVLIIAHRLQTVLDLDRIMVMEDGEIVEFDTVEALLNIPNGHFKTMATKAKLDKNN